MPERKDDAEAEGTNADGLTGADTELRRAVHQAIVAVTDVYRRSYSFNGALPPLGLAHPHVSCVATLTSVDTVTRCAVAIAELMKLSNAITDARNDPDLSVDMLDSSIRALVIMLAPLAPHCAAELWARLAKVHATVNGGAAPDEPTSAYGNMAVDDVHGQSWPVADPSALEETELTIALQMGGQLCGQIRIPRSLADEPTVRA